MEDIDIKSEPADGENFADHKFEVDETKEEPCTFEILRLQYQPEEEESTFGRTGKFSTNYVDESKISKNKTFYDELLNNTNTSDTRFILNSTFIPSEISKNQLQYLFIIFDEISDASPKDFWDNIAKTLNNEGRFVKTAYKWSEWLVKVKRQIKQKKHDGEYITELEDKLLKLKRRKSVTSGRAVPRMSDLQKQMLVKFFKEEPFPSSKAFWNKLAATLNNIGPCTKNPKKWRGWYTSQKTCAKRKWLEGTIVTDWERSILTSKRKLGTMGSPADQISERQKEIVIEIYETVSTTTRDFWDYLASELNAEGPFIKTAHKWEKWFKAFKLDTKKRKRNGETISEIDEKCIRLKRLPIYAVRAASEEQKLLLIKLFEEETDCSCNELWRKITKTLNKEGPCIQYTLNWKAWFCRQKIYLKKRKANGCSLSELEEKLLNLRRYSRIEMELRESENESQQDHICKLEIADA